MIKRMSSILCLMLFGCTVLLSQEQEESTQQDYLKKIQQVEAATKARNDSLCLLLDIPKVLVNSNGEFLGYLSHFDGMLIPRYVANDNIVAAANLSTNLVYPGSSAGFSLTGAGVVIGMWEARIDQNVPGSIPRITHEAFNNTGASRITVEDNTPNLQVSSHATHVAGTLIGNPTNKAIARGMAYGATLLAYSADGDIGEMSNAFTSFNLRLSNHSYGTVNGWSGSSPWVWFGDVNATEDFAFGQYDWGAREFDGFLVNHPYYTMVKSAGNDRGDGPPSGTMHKVAMTGTGPNDPNYTTTREKDGGTDGYDCLNPENSAKNMITVGSAKTWYDGNGQGYPYSQPSIVVASDFSGAGPSDDGRIKPDIVGIGEQLYSSSSASNTDYVQKSGTSMAAPTITGSIALLLQHQNNLHGANQRLLASTVKGLVIHTADECGTSTGPDYRFGWGLMNTLRAAEVMSQDENLHPCGLIREYTLHNGETIEYVVEVPSGSTVPLRATLCWTDPAGTPVNPPTLNDRTSMLVNNLDLRMIKLSGNVQYYPYELDPINPANAATATSDNDVDNVEMVHIASPSAGLYKVRVTHKGTLSANQRFSLIVTGQSTTNTELTLGTETVTTTKNYYASEKIIHNSGTQFTVASSGVVDLLAGEKITLRDGFKALYGSSLIAHISPCIATQYSIAKPQNTSLKQVVTGEPVSSFDAQELRLRFYPNPTSSESTIEYFVEESGRVEIGIYNVLGQLMFNIADIQNQESGKFQTSFNSYKLDVGTYLCKVKTITKTETIKFSVVK